MAFDPAAVLLLGTAEVLYLRATFVLRRRGYEIPFWQQTAWHGGIVLMATGLLSPLDGMSDELLSAHMAQHLLIADLAAPLLLVGLRSPVYAFMLPRAALVSVARRRRLRATFRFVRQPLVAIPIFVMVLYGWHFAPLFESALRHEAVHILQHQSFVLASVLVWWAPIDPKRRRLHGELWKVGHVLGARFAGMMLGMAFVIMRTPAYDAYGDGAREYGLTPLSDQQLGGGLMMSVDFLILIFAFCLFFWAAARDADSPEPGPARA